MIRINRCMKGRIVRHFHSRRRTPMKRASESHYPFFPRMKRSQFQGIFVGFCSRVDKERPIIRIPRQLTQLISQSFLQLIYDRIRIKHQLLQLLTHALHQIRMRMFHRNHGMSAIQIKIGLPLLVIYLTAFSPYDIHGKNRIHIKQFHHPLHFTI